MAGRGRGATLPAWMTSGGHNTQIIDLAESSSHQNRFEDALEDRHRDKERENDRSQSRRSIDRGDDRVNRRSEDRRKSRKEERHSRRARQELERWEKESNQNDDRRGEPVYEESKRGRNERDRESEREMEKGDEHVEEKEVEVRESVEEGKKKGKRRGRKRGRSEPRRGRRRHRSRSKSRSRSPSPREHADESDPEDQLVEHEVDSKHRDSPIHPPHKRRKGRRGQREIQSEFVYTSREVIDMNGVEDGGTARDHLPATSDGHGGRGNFRPRTGFRADWNFLCANIEAVWTNYESSSILECPSQLWYLIAVKKLFIRDVYKAHLDSFLKQREQRVSTSNSSLIPLVLGFIGTSGVGKSGFLQFLLLYLIHEAKQRGEVYTLRLSVYQGESKTPSDWRLHTDGQAYQYHEESVDYYLSDGVDVTPQDLSCVKIACLAVSSDSSDGLRQFEKLPDADIIPLSVWSLQELRVIAPASFTFEEIDIRYAIFGGSPRHFLGRVAIQHHSSSSAYSYAYVLKLIDWFFHNERSAHVLTEDQWRCISNYLIRSLSLAGSRENIASSMSAVKALMWHMSEGYDFFYASRFMSYLSQEILATQESPLREVVGKVVGEGHWFESSRDEYLGIKTILSSHQRCFALKGKSAGSRSEEVWQVGGLKLQRFTDKAEISKIQTGTYAIPNRADFPIIDAVVQPDKLLCFANGKHHTGSAEEVEELRGCLLEKDRSKHKFIWILDDLEDFLLPGEHLGDIAQYVMCYNDCVESLDGLTLPSSERMEEEEKEKVVENRSLTLTEGSLQS